MCLRRVNERPFESGSYIMQREKKREREKEGACGGRIESKKR